MTYRNEESVLIINLDERIDTLNSDSVKEEVNGIIAKCEFDTLILNASSLKYISSAGLRVILGFKKAHPNFKVVDVNPEVYEIFEMTGFTEIIEIVKCFKQVNVDGCQIIGKGAKGIVYKYNGDTVIKVYKNPDSLDDIKNERKLARKAFVLGIPTAISFDIVKVGDKYGSVFELLDAKSFSTLINENPNDVEKYANEFADMLNQFHSTKVNDVSDLPSGKDKFYKWLKSIKNLITNEVYEKLLKMIDEIPIINYLVHCDFQTNNIMVQNGESMIIDMDTLAFGHPIVDLAITNFCYDAQIDVNPEAAVAFLGFNLTELKKFWPIFIRRYLHTTDEKKIEEVTNKARLLALLRAVYFAYKHNDPQEDIDYSVKQINELINKVDSLVF